MRCILCSNFSIAIICKACNVRFLDVGLHKRELTDSFYNYSFYKYLDVKHLINTKYKFYGDRVYNILADKSFSQFSNNFTFDSNVFAIPIDDHTRNMFSHSSILANKLNSSTIQTVHSLLKAQNILKYAGKDLAYRRRNKRNFLYSGPSNLNVILIDDLITTGSTILEARDTLEKHNCNVLFSLTLSDAKIC
jgi:competence protein ComFC